MGAESFYTRSRSRTVEEAFQKAVEKAQYDHGHRGYTGTIAEKTSFKLVADEPLNEEKIRDLYEEVNSSEEESLTGAAREVARVFFDKWGPACAVEVAGSESGGTRLFVFFGLASS